MAPYVLPVFPVETFLKYQDFIGFKPATEEKGKLGKLPQQYADMFGWENMVATVAKVYNSLSPEEKQKCVIGASNYGEAGAIDFFGKKYGLPHAISGHNNYWIWGPGEKPGEIAIIVGGDPKDLLQHVRRRAASSHRSQRIRATFRDRPARLPVPPPQSDLAASLAAHKGIHIGHSAQHGACAGDLC